MDRRTLMARGAALAALFSASPLFAPAAHAQLAALPYRDQRVVREAAQYLQNLKLAKGRFVQTNSRGASSSGQIYLSRPGRARFEYAAPAQMLVVADGRNVSIYDRRLKTFDRYPLGATPLGIFLSRRIQLEGDVRVTGLTRTDGGFSIGLADPQGNADGQLVLEFADAPLALTGWTVIDGQGLKTHVKLQGLTPVTHLDPALFVLSDPSKAG